MDLFRCWRTGRCADICYRHCRIVSQVVRHIATDCGRTSMLTGTRPWIFYVAAIATAVIALMCCWMTESRPSQLLRQQVKDVARKNSFSGLSLDNADSTPDLKTFVRVHLVSRAIPYPGFWLEELTLLYHRPSHSASSSPNPSSSSPPSWAPPSTA